MKFKLGPFLAAVIVIGGIGVYNYWAKSRPYPTWQVTERDDATGTNRFYELRLEGRGSQEYTPVLILTCENAALKVNLSIGLVERIGGGMGSASTYVGEFFADAPEGSMTGSQRGWVVPENSVMLERWDGADFIRQLAAKPWFIASAGGSSTFHVEGLAQYLPSLGSRCDLTAPAAEQ